MHTLLVQLKTGQKLQLIWTSCMAFRFMVISIFMLAVSQLVAAQSSNKLTLASYFERTSEFREFKEEQKLDSILVLIDEYSGLHYPYQFLLREAQLQGVTQRALAALEAMLQDPQKRINANWTLANFYSSEPSRLNLATAYAYFTTALNHEPRPIELIRDFAEFLNRNQHLYPFEPDFGAIHFSPEEQSAFKNFVEFDQLLFGEVANRLNSGSSPLLNHHVFDYYLAQAQYQLGRNEQAQETFLQGLNKAEAAADSVWKAQFLIGLAFLGIEERNYGQVDSLLNQAAHCALVAQDAYLMQKVIGNRAAFASRRRNFDEARVLFRQAAKQAESLHAFNDVAMRATGMGFLNFQQQMPDSALYFYDKAEEVANRIQDEFRLVQVKLNRGDTFHNLRLDSLAIAEYNGAMNILQGRSWPRASERARSGLADTYFAKGTFNRAKTLYRGILQGSTPLASPTIETAWSHWRLGRIFQELNHLDSARTMYERAEAEFDTLNLHYSVAHCRMRQGELDFIEGNTADAMDRFQDPDVVREAGLDLDLRMELLFNTGLAQFVAGDLVAASSSLSNSTRALDSLVLKSRNDILSMQLFSKGVEAYDYLIQAQLQAFEKTKNEAHVDTVLAAIQKSRARLLRTKRLANVLRNRPALGHLPFESYEQTKNRFSRLQQQLHCAPREERAQLGTQLNALQVTLAGQMTRLATTNVDSSDATAILDTEMVKSIARFQDASLVFYHITNHQSFAIVATSQAVNIIKLPEQATTLKTKINRLLTPLKKVGERDIYQTIYHADVAHELYQSLVAPLRAHIDAGGEKLIIVQDGIAGILPFGMLLTQSPIRTTYTPLDFPDYAPFFLVNELNISTVPSVEFLESGEQAYAPTEDFFGYAFTGDQCTTTFPPLLYGEIELERISSIFPNAPMHYGQAANERAVLDDLTKQGVVHLAAHAVPDSTFDFYSMFILATGDSASGLDGRLMGYEIAEHQINSDLIVLSACETFQSRYLFGEGILGLPRVLLGAGAKAVLLTHWTVDGFFASEFMPLYYKHLEEKAWQRSAALQAAQTELLAATDRQANGLFFQHPVYWATFGLTGDPGVERDSSISVAFILLLVLVISVALILLWRAQNLKQVSK